MSTAASPVPERPRLVNVGRLSEQKGQLLLIQAAARLREEGLDFELVIVGDGPLRGQIEKLVEDLSALTVLEAAELSKLLEEKWGVSAAAPVAFAAPAAGAVDGAGGLLAEGEAAVAEEPPGDDPVVCVCPEWLLPASEHPAISSDRATSAAIRIRSG